MSKKFLFFVGLLFILGMGFGVSQKFHSWSAFQASTLALQCSRLADTHMIQCNDRAQAESQCAGLEYVAGTSYILQLPKTTLNAVCAGQELYWTKDIQTSSGKMSVATSSSTVVNQTTALLNRPCSAERYTCPLIEPGDTLVANWAKSNKEYLIVKKALSGGGVNYYQYVFDTVTNKWLFTSVKNQFFASNTGGIQSFYIKLPSTLVQNQGRDIVFEFGAIGMDGTVRDTAVQAINNTDPVVAMTNGFSVITYSKKSNNFAQANVWRIRINPVSSTPASADTLLYFTERPTDAPNVSANNSTRAVVLGSGVLATTIEVNIDNAGYTDYNSSTRYDGNHTVYVRYKAVAATTTSAAVPASNPTILYFTQRLSGAPDVTADDLNNKIVLGAGINGSLLEVSTDNGTNYTAYSDAATYLGGQMVKVRMKAIVGNGSFSGVSGWIPAAKVGSLETEIAFDSALQITNASLDWLRDFYSVNTAQLYDVVNETMETSSVSENTNLAIKGVFKQGDEVFIFTEKGLNGAQKVYYLLRNSGVLPDVPACNSRAQIYANNETNPTATQLLTGNKGQFLVIGDGIDTSTTVAWSVLNPNTSRLKNANAYASNHSSNIPFEVLASTVNDVKLDARSVLTAVIGSSTDACTMTKTVEFGTDLAIGVSAIKVMGAQ